MLSQAIGAVLPFAVAVALSPIPIVAVVVVLGTTRARSNGVTFALGWVGGLTVATTLVLVVAGGRNAGGDTSTALGVVQVVVGVGLILLAARKWRGRPRKGEDAPVPAWMAKLDELTPTRSLGLGAALSAANPKNLALIVAAGASVAEAGLTDGDEVLAGAVFVVIASITVAGAVLVYLVAGTRATAALERLKAFMQANNAVIMMVIILIFGVKILGDGIAALGN